MRDIQLEINYFVIKTILTVEQRVNFQNVRGVPEVIRNLLEESNYGHVTFLEQTMRIILLDSGYGVSVLL